MNRQQRRRQGKPQGMSYAEQIARGRMLREASMRAATDLTVQVKADIHTQKMSWLFMIALNDEFQFGQSRYERLAKAIHERSEWYEKMVKETDEDYAVEKLKQEAERVTREELEFAWDKEIQASKKKHENDTISRYDQFRFSKLQRMAETMCDWIDCQKCPGRELCSHKEGKANGLVLAEPRNDIAGGCVIVSGGMEVDLSTAALIHGVQLVTEGEVSRLLFDGTEA